MSRWSIQRRTRTISTYLSNSVGNTVSEQENVNTSDGPTKTKGFGKAPVKAAKPEKSKDIGTLTYEKQAKRGVPEYNIFLRPVNGTDVEWIPVGSMTIPRDTSIAKAVYEVEEELLKGTFKIYPQMKKFYDEKKQQRLGDYARDSVFEYGYCLKAFPDEPIIPIQKDSSESNKKNFLTDW